MNAIRRHNPAQSRHSSAIARRSTEELFNTCTHLAGVIFALTTAYVTLKPAFACGPALAMGVTCFTVAMLLMYAASTLYHWWMPGVVKRRLRVLDHISIYTMIAASYTPICIGVVGGTLGWTVFGIQWAVAVGGTIYKITAIDKWPRLSLFIYLVMGWTFVFVAEPVCSRITSGTLIALLSEGFFYTAGTYFFAHDNRPYYHGIWHIFVLLGSVAHWTAILLILL